MLYVTYLFVGVFGAQTLVGAARGGTVRQLHQPLARPPPASHIPIPLAREFLVGEYGLITMGLTYAIAIVLPVVTTFFLIFGFLEDSGYIPRLAIFSDRLFRAMGLNGKAVLPMVLGLGCDTMATMTTRILATPKERLIAIRCWRSACRARRSWRRSWASSAASRSPALVTLFAVVLSQMVLVGFLAARVLHRRAVGLHHGAAADAAAAAAESR